MFCIYWFLIKLLSVINVPARKFCLRAKVAATTNSWGPDLSKKGQCTCTSIFLMIREGEETVRKLKWKWQFVWSWHGAFLFIHDIPSRSSSFRFFWTASPPFTFWLLTEKKVSIDLEMSPCDVTKTKSRLSGLETTQGKSSKDVGRFEKIHGLIFMLCKKVQSCCSLD